MVIIEVQTTIQKKKTETNGHNRGSIDHSREENLQGVVIKRTLKIVQEKIKATRVTITVIRIYVSDNRITCLRYYSSQSIISS